MDTFRLKADFTFEAEDLDDAFGKLSEHFRKCAENEDSDLLTGGQCHLGHLDAFEAVE